VRIGPSSGRIVVSGNNFSDSYVGGGQVVRPTNDRSAAGLTLDGAAGVAIVGNLFSSLRPKALVIGGQESSRILFTDNVLVDAPVDHERLNRSFVEGNLSE